MPIGPLDVERWEREEEVDVGEWDEHADEQKVEVHEGAGGQVAGAMADHEEQRTAQDQKLRGEGSWRRRELTN